MNTQEIEQLKTLMRDKGVNYVLEGFVTALEEMADQMEPSHGGPAWCFRNAADKMREVAEHAPETSYWTTGQSA